jgi:hypothetical protein
MALRKVELEDLGRQIEEYLTSECMNPTNTIKSYTQLAKKSIVYQSTDPLPKKHRNRGLDTGYKQALVSQSTSSISLHAF